MPELILPILVLCWLVAVAYDQICLWKRLRAIEDLLLEKARLEGDLPR